MYLSIVAPCMNEEEVLEEFYLRILTVFKEMKISEYEIILIDDGSRDRTWEVIRLLNTKNPRVKGIQLSRNFGHQSALAAGLHEARGEYVFITDSDLQDPPELLPEMVKKMSEGFDVVYGQRRHRSGETKFKLLSASLFYKLLSVLADIEIPKDTGDFRLINRRVLEAYNRISESQRFTRGLISWIGFRQTALLYDRQPRFAGKTKYPLKKMINFSIDAVTGFSLKPLRLIIFLGILTSGVSIVAFLYSFYGWLFSKTVPGWASLMTVICLLSCVQLICLGVVGEYVGRIFSESKKRPLYFIQEKVGVDLHHGEMDLLKQKLLGDFSGESSLH